jgi:hypothetical protein
MAAPMLPRFTHWIFEHLLWDTGGKVREGFWGALRATRKLIIAFLLAALLTWREWEEHHPPEIALVAVLHFVFVLAVIALLVYIGQWFRRQGTKESGV